MQQSLTKVQVAIYPPLALLIAPSKIKPKVIAVKYGSTYTPRLPKVSISCELNNWLPIGIDAINLRSQYNPLE